MAEYTVQVGNGVRVMPKREYEDGVDLIHGVVAELRDLVHLVERDGTQDAFVVTITARGTTRHTRPKAARPLGSATLHSSPRCRGFLDSSMPMPASVKYVCTHTCTSRCLKFAAREESL